MLFNAQNVLSFLALCGLSSGRSMAWNKKRDTSSVSLYAYGGATNGAPVFYESGMAYIGFEGFDSSQSTNITFIEDPDDDTVPWYIAANSTDSNSTAPFTGNPMFYIVPTTNAFQQAGFVANSSDAPTGAVTTGFTWFGANVAYAASESDYEMMFWAVDTNTTDLWALYWNSNGTTVDNAIPITLKSTSPTTNS